MTTGNEPLPPPKVDARPDGYMGPAASFEKLVDSRMFITFARFIMILAGTIGLPIAGWMMTRVISSADTIVNKVDESAVELRLLKSEVKSGFNKSSDDISRHGEWLRDHEGRIRVIERDLRTGLPATNLPTRPN